MEAIETRGLTKKYKDVLAVDDLNLTIHEGELFALLGVNGAGKTTTIRMLSCLTCPTAGDALVGGASIVNSSAKVKEIIGVSPQETAVAPNLTVKENLAFMCGVYGLKGDAAKARMDALIDQLDLSSILTRRAGKLSGGWQRRVSIALALIGNPRVLFLDEPTLGLDVIARSELWDVIRALKISTTVILTTHYMEEAESLSDRVGIMKDGRLLCVGTPDEIRAQAGTDKFEEAFISIVKNAAKEGKQ